MPFSFHLSRRDLYPRFQCQMLRNILSILLVRYRMEDLIDGEFQKVAQYSSNSYSRTLYINVHSMNYNLSGVNLLQALALTSMKEV